MRKVNYQLHAWEQSGCPGELVCSCDELHGHSGRGILWRRRSSRLLHGLSKACSSSHALECHRDAFAWRLSHVRQLNAYIPEIESAMD